jgi:hypothetical protein
MRQVEVNALRDEEITEPVPPPGGFHDGLMLPGELGEVLGQEPAVVGEGDLGQALAGLGDGSDDGGEPVLVDAGIEPRGLPSRGSGS